MLVSDVDWLVPHQANIRIIEGMQKKWGCRRPRCEDRQRTCQYVCGLYSVGAFCCCRRWPYQDGQVLAFEAIGGGLVWGAALVRYGRPAG